MNDRLRPGQLVVLFDGACGLCAQVRASLASLDLRRNIAWLPLQTPELLPCVGLDVARANETVHALTPEGRLLAGAQAVGAIVDALLPAPLGPFSRLLRNDRLRRLADAAFHLVSENRKRLLACRVPPPGSFTALTRAEYAELTRRLGPPALPV